MLHKVAAIFKSVYNKITKEQHTVQPTELGEWYLHTPEYQKAIETTTPDNLDILFNEGVNYYG